MRHGSLFSGIGGFDLAAEWMGWENVFQVEKDSFCQKVLAKNFPGTARYGDIKDFDGTRYRGAVDILTGGFPCQPFSSAGKRKGTKDDRYLWPEMLRVVREVQPSYIVGENVYGLVNWSKGLVFEQVCADLENEGYQVQPVILPACAVDAPHRRDRVWFVAYSEGNHDRRTERELCEANGRQVGELLPAFSSAGERLCEQRITLNSKCESNGKYFTGTSSGVRLDLDRNKLVKAGREQSSNDLKPSINGWQDFPTQPPLCDGDDGLPVGLVRSAVSAGGNAIVPQVAYEIFKAIESVLSHDNKSTSPAVTLPSEVEKENTQVRNNQKLTK